MLELLAYLRASGFKTFIVSGGSVEFMRAWAGRVYGIPPEQVVGSSGVTKFELRPDGTPVLTKEAKVEFIDDGPGKPSGINRFIGRRPILAFGNSDGDQQMLQWTDAGRAFDVQQRQAEADQLRAQFAAAKWISTKRWCGRRLTAMSPTLRYGRAREWRQLQSWRS